MRRIGVLSAVLGSVVAMTFVGGAAQAHPPDNPYDNTIFAPVRAGGVRIGLETVARGLTAPVKGVAVPGHRNRLFVADQVGRLSSLDLTTGRATVILDVTARLVPLGIGGPGTFDERGFLAVAPHPDFARNGLLYTYTSEPVSAAPTFPTTVPAGMVPDHQNVVAEWRVPNPGDPGSAVDPNSRRELIRVDWPQFNHNGGDITFGPDGLLYIPMGDGGGGDDEGPGHANGNGQNPTNALGDILRIDVNTRNSANGQYGIPAQNVHAGQPGLIGEIFASGFRNPWRLSFDRQTRRLYVGDVGQNDVEEVNIVVSGGNYGWHLKEGTLFFNPNGTEPGSASRAPFRDVPPGLQNPIAQYDTHFEGHAVIGGFVYRGHRVPQLRGRYVFGDYSRLLGDDAPTSNYGRIFYLATDPHRDLAQVTEVRGFADAATRLGLTDPTRPEEAFPQTLAVLAFAQDADGELYVLGNVTGTPFGATGVVLRITAR